MCNILKIDIYFFANIFGTPDICLIQSRYFKTVRLFKNDILRQKLAGGRGLFGERCLIFRLNLKLAVFAHFWSFKPQTLDRLIFRSTNPSTNPSTAAKQYFCKGVVSHGILFIHLVNKFNSVWNGNSVQD